MQCAVHKQLRKNRPWSACKPNIYIHKAVALISTNHTIPEARGSFAACSYRVSSGLCTFFSSVRLPACRSVLCSGCCGQAALYFPDVLSAFKQVCCIAVAQRVRRNMLLDAGFFSCSPYHALHRACSQWLAVFLAENERRFHFFLARYLFTLFSHSFDRITTLSLFPFPPFMLATRSFEIMFSTSSFRTR